MRKRLCPKSRNTSEGVVASRVVSSTEPLRIAAACEYRSRAHHLSALRLPGPHSAAKLHKACI